MTLIVCSACGMHHYKMDSSCPHCDHNRKRNLIGRCPPSATALLLGLGLVGCYSGKDTGSDTAADTATEPSAEPDYGVPQPADEPEYGVVDTGEPDPEPSSEPSIEPEYGVSMTDEDGDGYYAEEDDCDDNNAEIHPGAEETPGDGIDSNCNGDDDT